MEKSLIENTFVNMRRAARKMRHLQMLSYQNTGDLRLVRIMSHHFPEGATPSQLANRMEVSLPTISQKLTILENQGLIKREVSKEDRRKTNISVTEKGNQVIDEEYRNFMGKMASVVEKLGEEKCTQLCGLLNELASSIDEEIRNKEGVSD